MPLKSQVNDDLKAAMLSGDRFLVETLRGLKAVILNEEIAKGLRNEGLSDDVIEKLFAHEAKKRDEAAELYDRGERPESAAKERAEKIVILKYLPTQLDEAALQPIIDEVVAELKPEGPKDMGRLIGAVKARVGNSADGALIARLVKSSL
ncbi:GatB/YqeY domain-containing protein [Pedobacter sp.]|nr:GatB/YqeY domain-containing protein [Candidatus Saccharibacteria bacterium]